MKVRSENGTWPRDNELGQITTKDIVVGVRDWENTEVLEGLERGEEVLLLPSTSLLPSQDRLRSWAQGRSGIPGIRIAPIGPKAPFKDACDAFPWVRYV